MEEDPVGAESDGVVDGVADGGGEGGEAVEGVSEDGGGEEARAEETELVFVSGFGAEAEEGDVELGLWGGGRNERMNQHRGKVPPV